uniref:Uncharacterized protein n=1 Tax=Anguilla anguilla TaxID=7936 RepID=A0A0E9RER1_ANGAN
MLCHNMLFAPLHPILKTGNALLYENS